MKRHFSSAVGLLLAVLCAVLLCACGQTTDNAQTGGGDASAQTGDAQTGGTAEQGGDSQTPQTPSAAVLYDVKYIQADNIDNLTPEYLPYVMLKTDGTGEFFVNLLENAFAAKVNYTISGNTLLLTAASGVLDYFGSTEAQFTIDSTGQLTFVKANTGNYIGATTEGSRFSVQQ